MSQQFPWGPPSQQQNGGRPPSISTAASAALNSQGADTAAPQSQSPSRSAFPPLALAGSAATQAANRRSISRNSSVSSVSATFSPSQSGSQQQTFSQLLSSGRNRATVSTGNPPPASSAAGAPTTSQGAGVGANGGGGGTTKLARGSPSLSQSSGVGSPIAPTSAPAPNSQSFAKIVIAQIFLLLSGIPREDQDRAKWESQTEQVRKLVDSSGMEVYSKYFRRLLQGNAAQIFAPAGRVEPATTYHIIVGEMQKLRHDPHQAEKIAESIDTTEGDFFRDFDLSTFMEHFKLDPISRFTLALELKDASKPDLRSKAEAIISQYYLAFLESIIPPKPDSDIAPSHLAHIIEKIAQEPPRTWSEEMESHLRQAIELRYQKLGTNVPAEVIAALQIGQLLNPGSNLVRLIHRTGPRGTTSAQSCQELLANVETRDINYTQVADTLLYMALVENGQAYNAANFVNALRDHRAGKRLDWQDVVHAFDRPGLQISKSQFLVLYNALLPLAQDYENFDIQLLWGGSWQNKHTQIYFVVAFLTCSSDELDITRIPRLRKAFALEDFQDSSESIKEFAASVANHPLVSLDATAAIFSIIFESREVYDSAQQIGIPDIVINANTQVFVVAAAAVPKPWGGLQDQALRQLFKPFVEKRVPHYDFVFEGLWKRDSKWLAEKLTDIYLEQPIFLLRIFEHAEEHGWLNALVGMNTELSLDLASYAHGRGALDIDAWAQKTMQAIPDVLPKALASFLSMKAESDIQLRNPTGSETQTVPLTIKTVYAFLGVLEGQLPDEEILQLQRSCLQAYPRLINYGIDDNIDAVLDANGRDGNFLPPEIEARMTEYFKRLYRQELQVHEYIAHLKEIRRSEVSEEQDLFVSMISGLLEEYNCFGEYPLEALATTAVLFGGIINYNLLSSVALQVALSMVLEAVQEHPIDDSMYKFGLQALLHFTNRLEEWPTFCERLLRVPLLKGTDVWPKAEEIVRRAQEQNVNGDSSNGLTNGNVDALTEPAIPNFTCVAADPVMDLEPYEDPDEDTQDKVLFVLNNISERNLQDKSKDLKEALEEKHHQWFAGYLVEERAKSQPNFQPLYLQMLEVFDDRKLWAEVLRETYKTITKLLNAESTMHSTQERTNLKNLGGWLGSLTLARDKPIKFKNISFKDLLIEGHDTQRLTIVLPFTCKTLAQGARSIVFKPPNPWMMEIVRVLKELYQFVEMKLNLKFEVEVLCKDLNLDINVVEPSDSIRSRPMQDDDFLSNIMSADGMDQQGFNDLSLMSLHRTRGANDRFSGQAIMASLPSFHGKLIYPPSPSNLVNKTQLERIMLDSTHQALQEIIAPVVERSVTIAAISAAQLVSKDFATEPDIDRYRNAAGNMVKALSGSLALVTCKEPLRMSITNNIRLLAKDLPEQALPEGLILMFVNDNLDTICNLIEQAAESQSVNEIEHQIREGIHARQTHRDTRPHEPFEFPSVSPWALYIPDPYKQQQGGLSREQLAIYEDFCRHVRGLPGHGPTPSQDAGRQLPDVIQDSQFPAIPNLPTPAEAPAIPRQAMPQQRLQPGPPLAPGLPVQPHLNGFMDPELRAGELFEELRRHAKESNTDRIKDLAHDNDIRTIYEGLHEILLQTPVPARDEVCIKLAWAAYNIIFDGNSNRLETEVMANVLVAGCQYSVETSKIMLRMLYENDDGEHLFNLPATVCLLENEVLDLKRVDSIMAKFLRSPDSGRASKAAEFLADLAEEVLTGNNSYYLAFRADFARSFEALTHVVAENPNFELGKSVAAKLQINLPDASLPPPPGASKQDQLEYVFDEWVHLHQSSNVSEKATLAFIKQLSDYGVLRNREDSILFLRVCVDASVAAWENEMIATGNQTLAYTHVDALARLIVFLIVYQGEPDGAVKANKAGIFEGILALIILVMCNHHQQRGGHFAQKVFYRLFATTTFELHRSRSAIAGFEKDIMLVLGRGFLAMQPRFLPGFSFGWIALISHRMFMPAMLKMADQAGWDLYIQTMETLLEYVGELVKPVVTSELARDMYRSVLRILLVLHHDFPEFLAEHHIRLCNAIPAHCTQLRNLVISAYPSTYPELPDPFASNLKVDRIEDVRKAPPIRYDADAELSAAGIKSAMDALLSTPEDQPLGSTELAQVVDACNRSSLHNVGFGGVPLETDHILITAIVLAIGSRAVETIAAKNGQVFQSQSPHAKLLNTLARQLRPESRYHFLSAIVNQLRYPNSHTHWFSYALLAFFSPAAAASDDEELLGVQQQATRVLLERLLVHRPHPWGLIITLLELLKNTDLGFWQLPFVKAAPECS
ncbi:Not1-domain-containing protein [Rhizodiscina lignyota]|uniref:General negative regulator of transcription subunit 1 n=1 Tax=Rhizodiscina lignyota TaxID=1504668 RepID=A0A9P4IE24_9PEZI|nr:Not1-domain-containing protein [Rhizodiscina lignyota]